MCRDCSHGGRRCPGDSSEARRARRYAAAGKKDPRVKESVRGTPPSVAGGEDGTPTPGHDLSTPEGLKGRAEELRASPAQAGGATEECIDLSRENEGKPDRAMAEEIVKRHGVDPGLMKFHESPDGSVMPILSMRKCEQESTALGQKTDQWLDRELTAEKQVHEEAASTYADADKAYMSALGTESTKDAYDARENARVSLNQARSDYYARKRELMGQLRENGQELEWTTAGTSTPGRVNETIQHSARFLPKDWIDSSNHLSSDEEVAKNRSKGHPVLPVRVRESASRNHYSPRNYITKRETSVKQSFYSEDLAKKIDVYNSPRYGVVPEEEWSENDRRFATPGEVLVREYDIARRGAYFDTGPGAGALDGEGNFRLTGRAASGWREHTYTNRDGEEQTVWRKPATRTETSREYGIAELTIPKGQGRKGAMDSTTTHELVHRCEDTNDSIPKMESEFLKRRTTNADGEREKFQRYYPGSREKVRPDDFIDRYVGKDYGHVTFHEVMSVGSEAAFHGSHGGFGKLSDPVSRAPERRDDDHHAFVLGTYMTA